MGQGATKQGQVAWQGSEDVSHQQRRFFSQQVPQPDGWDFGNPYLSNLAVMPRMLSMMVVLALDWHKPCDEPIKVYASEACRRNAAHILWWQPAVCFMLVLDLVKLSLIEVANLDPPLLFLEGKQKSADL